MLKLEIDNSDKFWDADLEMYVDEEPIPFPYQLIDDEGVILATFPTWKGAVSFQMGMGFRATSTIEIKEY